MSLRLASLLAAAALAACSSAPPKPEDATSPPASDPHAADVLLARPPLPPLHAFDAPKPSVEKLPNGLTLVVIERPDDPLESLLFTTSRGADADGDHPGLASLTDELLQSGSAGRSAEEMATRINALGTELEANVDRDGLIYGLTVLPSQVEAAASTLADVALHPNLDPKEFERVKTERLAKLVSELDDPHVLSREVFDAAIYGASAYGTPVNGSQASIQALTLDDVKRFNASIHGGDCAVIAAGGMHAEAMKALLSQRFGSAPAGSAGSPTIGAPASSHPSLVVVNKANAPQSVLRYGMAVPEGLGLAEREADELLNIILGGSFTSRLNQNLREKHGYAYGAHSIFDWTRHGGTWAAHSDVRADATGDAVHELEGEVAGILAQSLTAEELSKAKALSVESLVERLQASQGVAEAYAEFYLLGRPLDELSQLIPTVEKVTLDDVKAASAHALDPARLTLVVVGDAASVAPQLARVGLPAAEGWTDTGHEPREQGAAAAPTPAKASKKRTK